eukprot:4700958-Amphidinium_carterae.2
MGNIFCWGSSGTSGHPATDQISARQLTIHTIAVLHKYCLSSYTKGVQVIFLDCRKRTSKNHKGFRSDSLPRLVVPVEDFQTHLCHYSIAAQSCDQSPAQKPHQLN